MDGSLFASSAQGALHASSHIAFASTVESFMRLRARQETCRMPPNLDTPFHGCMVVGTHTAWIRQG